MDEARRLMQEAVDSMNADKKQYMETVPLTINTHAKQVLQTASVEILKRRFLKEVQEGK